MLSQSKYVKMKKVKDITLFSFIPTKVTNYSTVRLNYSRPAYCPPLCLHPSSSGLEPSTLVILSQPYFCTIIRQDKMVVIDANYEIDVLIKNTKKCFIITFDIHWTSLLWV